MLLIVKVSHSRIHCLDLCANLDGHLEVTFICVGELAQLMKLFVLGRLKKSKMLLGWSEFHISKTMLRKQTYFVGWSGKRELMAFNGLLTSWSLITTDGCELRGIHKQSARSDALVWFSHGELFLLSEGQLSTSKESICIVLSLCRYLNAILCFLVVKAMGIYDSHLNEHPGKLKPKSLPVPVNISTLFFADMEDAWELTSLQCKAYIENLPGAECSVGTVQQQLWNCQPRAVPALWVWGEDARNACTKYSDFMYVCMQVASTSLQQQQQGVYICLHIWFMGHHPLPDYRHWILGDKSYLW